MSTFVQNTIEAQEKLDRDYLQIGVAENSFNPLHGNSIDYPHVLFKKSYMTHVT